MFLELDKTLMEREILSALEKTAQIALGMLPRMIVREGSSAGLFCQKLRGAAPGRLEREGVSARYSIIALIGIGAVFGAEGVQDDAWRASLERLSQLLDGDRLTLGELGLLLWLDPYVNGAFAPRVCASLSRRWRAEKAAADTMECAWILAGLAKNVSLPAAERSALTKQALKSVLGAYNPGSQLFCLNGHAPRGYWNENRYQRVLGSFASQIYPLFALSASHERHPDPRILNIVHGVAGRMAALQGAEGQWWWIFDVRTGSVFLDYPVYSVHQDAMGPMGLLAASRAAQTGAYLPALSKGLEYLFRRAGAWTGGGLVDESEGMIWRAVVRDVPGEDPADMPFGLGCEDMGRVRSAGRPRLFQSRDTGRPREYRVLKEARPYCAGWILFAYAQACEMFGERPGLEMPGFLSACA